MSVIMLYLLLGTPDSKKTSRCIAPTLTLFDGDLTNIPLIHGPSFSFISSAGSWFISTSSQSWAVNDTIKHAHILWGGKNGSGMGRKRLQEVGTVVRSRFHNLFVVHKWNLLVLKFGKPEDSHWGYNALEHYVYFVTRILT